MLSDRRISQKVGLTQTLSRRGLLKGAGTAVALGAAGGTSRAYGQNAPSKPLVYVGFGGAYQAYLEKAILRPFQKATGIEIQSVTGANNIAKLKAMVESGDVTWDIIDVTGAALGTYDAAGLLKKLDYSQITVPKLIEASVQQPSGMGYYVYSHNIWWNTSVIKGPLNSWAEVWDAKTHPGKRGFQNQAVYSPEEALLADGVPLDKVYPMDIDRIFKDVQQDPPVCCLSRSERAHKPDHSGRHRHWRHQPDQAPGGARRQGAARLQLETDTRRCRAVRHPKRGPQ